MNPAKITALLPTSLRTVVYLSCCLALAVPVPASPGPPGTGRTLPLLILLALALLALTIVTISLFLKKKRLETALSEAARTEQKLSRTADIYQVLVNNIHEVIFTLDMDFRFTYISPSVKRQRGFTVEEAMNLDISGNVTPDSAHRIFDLVSRGVARIEQGRPAKTPLVMSIETYCKDGSIRQAELTADFLYAADGRPEGMIGVSRYLNDQDEIKSKLTLFRQAVEGTSEAIALTTMRGSHFYHNRAFAELFGYKTPEEVETDGGPVALFQDRLLGEKIFNTLTKGSPWSGETVMLHRDGGEIPVFLKADAIRDKYGTVMALMGSMTDISPIKERETAMKRQESLYRLLADNISEIISIIDLETQSHIYVSPSVERIRGFTPEEVMSQVLPEVMTPASYEMASGVIAEELENDNRPDTDPNRYRTLELEQFRKDGSTVWTEVMAAFLRDDNGRPASILTAARDITERKKAETAIRESEERYRMLAENISEAIYTIDLETLRHTYASPSVLRMYGFTPEEFIARPIEEVMTPASLELTLATVSEELGKDGQTGVDPNRHITLELELYRRDGSTIWVETTVKILRNESGAPASALGMARDITERKKAETAIRESEELYRLLADNTTEIIAIVSLKDMALMYVSPSIEKLKGFTVEEALTMTLESMLTPSSYQLTMEVITEELERDGRPGVDPDRHRTIEVEQTRRDGSFFWTEVAATFLRDENGRPVSILTTSRDITERKKAEDSMKRARLAASAVSLAR
ncbi:MAG: PAS domain-containing protein, partial [Desulfosudaceae bacterium]